MNRFVAAMLLCLLVPMLLSCSSSGDADRQSAEEGGEEHVEDEHGEHEEEGDFARIDPETAGEHGIEVQQAAGGTVSEVVLLTGQLIIDPRAVALVRARFAGPVKSVEKDIGDEVRRGDVLARVESNDSLAVYDVTSPIAGVVLERMTNVGDVAGAEPLFRIGDLTNLQAELRVFPNDRARVARDAGAVIRIGDQEVPGKVASFVPEIDTRTQALLARVTLAPQQPIAANPGQFVSGQVLVGSGEAEVAVPSDAVQRFEGNDVVFVPEEEGFRPRAVTTGRRSVELIEIVSGLEPGEEFVSAGAFLVKAEIGKAAASHDH